MYQNQAQNLAVTLYLLQIIQIWQKSTSTMWLDLYNLSGLGSNYYIIGIIDVVRIPRRNINPLNLLFWYINRHVNTYVFWHGSSQLSLIFKTSLHHSNVSLVQTGFEESKKLDDPIRSDSRFVSFLVCVVRSIKVSEWPQLTQYSWYTNTHKKCSTHLFPRDEKTVRQQKKCKNPSHLWSCHQHLNFVDWYGQNCLSV